MPRAPWILISVVLGLAGCSESKFVPVQGLITVDGQPRSKLFVQFEPLADGKNLYPGPGSVGRTNDEGVFELVSVPERHPGAVAGKHMVRIFAEGGADDDELLLQGQSIKNRPDRPKQLPARYNNQTELTFEVPRGGTREAHFTLTSK